jgi:carbonic anhydrase
MHRRQAKAFAGFALPLCASIGFAADNQVQWSYKGEAGPEKWGGLDAADAACWTGGQQSPIDITGAIAARHRRCRSVGASVPTPSSTTATLSSLASPRRHSNSVNVA